MNIPLNQFEQYIDETILKRGLSYFKKGCVNEPVEVTPGVYEAIVTGSENYTVKLKIKNEALVEHLCTCPYDMGPVCKHIAAVLFYLQQNELGLGSKARQLPEKREKASAKKGKKKTAEEQVKDVLETISHEELKQFILEKAAQEPSFRNIFLTSFIHRSTGESKEFYARQVKSILRTAAGREGFIYRSQTGSVGRSVNELLISAQKQSENKNYRSAVYICTALMEEMTVALQFSDDSNGDLSSIIYAAFDLLSGIAKEDLSEEVRILLLEYCIKAFEKGTYSDWDWHIGVLQLASRVVKTEEAQRIITLIESGRLSEYETDRALSIKLDLIKKTRGEKEAEEFIRRNLSIPAIRSEAIANALTNKEYEKAIKLSLDGIKQDEKDKPGVAKEWVGWLLKIAQAQNDTEKIIDYARALFIDNFKNEQDYYQVLKDHVNPEKWTAFVEGMIKEIALKHRPSDFNLIADIYIREQWWSRLLELIKMNPYIQYIEHYEKYLAGSYAPEVAELYRTSVIEYVRFSTGRNHYKTACRYLRRMLKLGAREKVNEIIEFFRKEYPQRTALLEELNTV
jgi:hypothetical protein